MSNSTQALPRAY